MAMSDARSWSPRARLDWSGSNSKNLPLHLAASGCKTWQMLADDSADLNPAARGKPAPCPFWSCLAFGQ